MYKNSLTIGPVAIVVFILLQHFITFALFNLEIYNSPQEALIFYISFIIVDLVWFWCFILFCLRYKYTLLILLSISQFFLDVVYYYLIYKDITEKEYLENLAQIDAIYYLVIFNLTLFSIVLIFSKSRHDKYLRLLGILSFFTTVINLTLGYYNAYMTQHFFNYISPFIYLILIKRYLIELDKISKPNEELIDC